MKISSFIESQCVRSAFGGRRVDAVDNAMRALWPGFPKGDQQCNEFITAWLIAILCKCRSYTKTDVARAIRDISELRCGDKLFIPWFGNLLHHSGNIRDISSIFLFQKDNMVVVHNPKGTLIFQGKRRAAQVDRAAILSHDFLMELRELIAPVVEEAYVGPVFEYDGGDADDVITFD